MSGRRVQAVLVFALWGLLAFVASLATSAAIKLLGRSVAPAFGGTMVGLLILIGVVVIIWGLSSLAVNFLSASLFALILAHFFLATGPAAQISLPARFRNELEVEGKHFRVSWATLVGALAVAVATRLRTGLRADEGDVDRSVRVGVRASWRIGVEAREHV